MFFYKQKFDLPIVSPLSGVLADLFLTFSKFKFIIPKDSRYFRYIEAIN